MLQQFLSSGNLFEREESIVVYFDELEDRCVAGLSGEDRPRVCVSPLPPCLLSDPVVLEPFLRTLFFSSLLVNVSERRCLFCVDFASGTGEAARALLSRVLAKLRCPALAFLSAPLAACVALGLKTALVLHGSGAALPVTEGALALGTVVLAQPDDEMAKSAARAVANSPLDLRLALVQNVVLLGVKNFTAEQLRQALPEGLREHAKFVKNPFGGQSLPWLGSSIVGTTLNKKSAGVPVIKGEEMMKV